MRRPESALSNLSTFTRRTVLGLSLAAAAFCSSHLASALAFSSAT